MTRRLFAAFGLAALASVPLVRADDKDKEKVADLIGGYTIVSGEKDGIPEPRERIEGVTVRIAEDGIVVVDKDKKELYADAYKIDVSSKPWKITLTSKLAPREGQVARGLIAKDGDTVKLIYALPGRPEPTDFKTKEKQLMFVLKNLRK